MNQEQTGSSATAPGTSLPAGARPSIWRTLVGWTARLMPDPGLPLEYRLFEVISLLWLVVIVFFILPSNFYLGLPLPVNGVLLVYGALSFWTWREARRGRIHAKTFLAGMMVSLHISWFVSDGSHGSTGPYFVVASIIPVIFNRGRTRVALVAAIAINLATLLILDHLFPQWSAPYAGTFDRTFDMASGYVACIMGTAVAVYIVLASYHAERERLVAVNAELAQALGEVRTLRGLLPICSWCKRIRNDDGSWTQVEQYVTKHTSARFSHGLCPDCYATCAADAEQATGPLAPPAAN